MRKTNQAFTLIEMLVTLALIALIVTISTFAINAARVSARDNRRKSDLEFIRSGLELYRSDCGGYPSNLSFGGTLRGNNSSSSCRQSNIYISKIPNDPQSSRRYSYRRLSTQRYSLCASLESPGTSMDTSTCSSCGVACNYITQSP